ncbi:histidine kinase N-terminal 7TM domain-containing protein [Paenibacillus aurantiacus]|uniref:Histidine kinase N-terminal 7TM domain-containing protein n=1 Tax=Paenibacillus aurantiacus TaxID=1936118 RepID=A0ABV5KRK7_9BACL
MSDAVHNYIVIICVSGVLSVLLGIYACTLKSTFSGLRTFLWISVFSAIYTFSFALELASTTYEEALRWTYAEFFGMPFLAPCCLLMVMQYIGLDRFVTRRNLMLMFAIPAITLLMVLTNEYHHLFYADVYIRPGESSLFLDIEIGPWYIVNGSYTFGCLLFGGILLIRQWRGARSAYRLQMAILIANLYIPMVTSFLYLMGLTPYGMDLVPVTLCVVNGLYIWSIVTSGLLTVAPVARAAIFESMRDAVLVLDPSGRVADYNGAALRLIPMLGQASIGRTLRELPLTPAVADLVPSLEALDEEERDLRWMHADGTLSWYKAHAWPVMRSRKQLGGKAIVFVDVTESVRLHDELRHLATTDGLTQIANRAYFMQGAQELLTKSRLAGQPCAIVLLDIDHFKSVNDEHGHAAGDQALRHVVAHCLPHLRSVDLFGRYGGEEFVLCLPTTDTNQAMLLAERLRGAIASHPLPLEQLSLPLTASFGVAVSHSPHDTLDTLLRQADDALYRAKRGGRNAVEPGARSRENVPG